MIHYNNLYITEDSKYLVIDVAIDEDSTYDDVYLYRIAIDTQDTYITNGPSNNAKIIFLDEGDIEKPSMNGIEEVKNSGKDSKKVKHTKLTLSAKDLGVNLNKDMLFIYSTASGFIPEDKPDVLKYITDTILNVVVNTYEVYKSIIPLIKEIGELCKDPISFIDRELQIKAVEYSIKNSNYLLAIKYWKKYFMDNTITSSSNKCNCNGNSQCSCIR
jgi:hypothetical protein|nr:MAG TPA: hypothetical protein [Crassvirales sp.]